MKFGNNLGPGHLTCVSVHRVDEAGRHMSDMARRRINKKKLLIALSPVLVLLAIVGIAVFLWTLNVMEVRNSSGLRINEFTMTVCNRTHKFTDLSHGETRKIRFIVTGDSNFQMRATLQNGTVLTNSFGYVTGGAGAYNNRVTVTVRHNLIEGMQH